MHIFNILVSSFIQILINSTVKFLLNKPKKISKRDQKTIQHFESLFDDSLINFYANPDFIYKFDYIYFSKLSYYIDHHEKFSMVGNKRLNARENKVYILAEELGILISENAVPCIVDNGKMAIPRKYIYLGLYDTIDDEEKEIVYKINQLSKKFAYELKEMKIFINKNYDYK